MTDITNVTVLGTGVLGSQIAYQTAYHGFSVVAYDIDDAALGKAKVQFDKLVKVYTQQVEGAADGKAAAALERITLSSNLEEAVQAADLVIEAVPENLDIKRDTYTKIGGFAPEHTIFATNSSTLLPSDFMDSTGRPEKFLALHFANQIWVRNTAEVMGTSKTDPAVYRTVVDFASAIGMVPIELKKEQPGYVLNSLLVPFLDAAGLLLVDGVADPAMIDKTWRIATGAPLGPCQIYDIIGLTTPYNIASQGNEDQRRLAAFLKENYIDKGKLGISTGEGLYKYPKS
ncbi:3-hydroxyacyl-CoA dehydrogenase [Rhodococcus sp. PAMC28707]|uniref:3-hydroxyacyl-CoA dehydrogenase n=1 Tax=unclassified Rhodococcus (in: high G+C Gram-positive bacteria) TaxID=192944 RepID=UPI00109DF287|nr:MULTISPECIES: 3-hydroxyacyl-CoA dehydrogenase [unclassified Rhodococcus (in: high G+C Gram-positive bacteria)]QCB49848.1 3-hydroxyacyl-CoA dehydrogenase [Rhodococcus sp. PAMC28705]QCB58459.1 3-hydroxyacyl-CoA dehydrogenase [Rhodococcus sp. PAMC28707]